MSSDRDPRPSDPPSSQKVRDFGWAKHPGTHTPPPPPPSRAHDLGRGAADLGAAGDAEATRGAASETRPCPPPASLLSVHCVSLNKPSSSTTTTSSSLSASRALPPHARWPRSPPWLLLLGLAPAPACALASRASPRDRRVGEAAGEEVWRAWERSGGSLGQSGPPNGVQPSQKSESAALRLLVRSLLMRLLCSGELGVQIKHLPQDCPCLHHSLLTLCTQALTHAT